MTSSNMITLEWVVKVTKHLRASCTEGMVGSMCVLATRLLHANGQLPAWIATDERGKSTMRTIPEPLSDVEKERLLFMLNTLEAELREYRDYLATLHPATSPAAPATAAAASTERDDLADLLRLREAVMQSL